MIERVKLLLGLLVVVAAANVGAEGNAQKIYRRVLPSVCTLEVENGKGDRFVGSGVVALADDVAVTAWHVIFDARVVWAVFSDGQRVRVTGCIDRDATRDLALIKLEKRLPQRRAGLARQMQSVASRAYVIGAPKGYSFSISDGLVSQIREVDGFAHYQISCPISPGNSGGPVTNDRGEVIGIASWTKADAQNVSFAVPIRELATLDASRAPVPWGEMQRTPSPARPPKAGPTSARATVSPAPKAPKAPETFESLKKLLERSAGKTINISVEEDGQENHFKFVVPSGGLK